VRSPDLRRLEATAVRGEPASQRKPVCDEEGRFHPPLKKPNLRWLFSLNCYGALAEELRTALKRVLSRQTRWGQTIVMIVGAMSGSAVSLVESLLWFARAQNLDRALMAVVNVADIVRSQLAGLAEGRVPLGCDLPDEALSAGICWVASPPTCLRQFSTRGTGSIAVEARCGGETVRVAIANGLHRGETARFRSVSASLQPGDDVPGFGLGLPFARAVARGAWRRFSTSRRAVGAQRCSC
jgi:hypothetical protein